MNHPILLAVELSNGHFMSCRLLHPNSNTLSYLQSWHQHLLQAIKLVELGDLYYLEGPQATALHRDWGEEWINHQPRFSRTRNHLRALARSIKAPKVIVYSEASWKECNSNLS